MTSVDKAITILKKVTSAEVTDLNNDLKNDLAIDSLGRVLLVIEIEDSCHIKLEDSDMDPLKLNTVADIVNIIEKYNEVII